MLICEVDKPTRYGFRATLPGNQKYCPTCKKAKFTEEFHRCASRSDGLNAICADCVNTATKGKRSASLLKYRLDNKSKKAAYDREYRAKNKEKRARLAAQQRAKKNNVPHEPWNRKEIYDRDEGICHLCLEHVGPLTKQVHVDHIYPISKGGWDVKTNLKISHAACNNFKKAKIPIGISPDGAENACM